MRIILRPVPIKFSPDLAARAPVVIHKADAKAGFSGNSGRGNPSRPSAHNHDIEGPGHSVTTSIPGTHITWQVLWCFRPSTVALHSMQIPIPHIGARGSPRTEIRQGSPAIIIAAATLISVVTRTSVRFTLMMKLSVATSTLRKAALPLQFTAIGVGLHALPHSDGFAPITKCSTPPVWISSHVMTGIVSSLPFSVAL